MALKYAIELEFEKDPARVLKELGLKTKQFQKIKENILTRLMAHPELTMIVLEFRREGMFLGEIRQNEYEHYTEARKQRSEDIGRASRRDQDRLEEPEVSGDDGSDDGKTSSGGRVLESLLRRAAEAVRSERPTEAHG
jgi:hypothetical protein